MQSVAQDNTPATPLNAVAFAIDDSAWETQGHLLTVADENWDVNLWEHEGVEPYALCLPLDRLRLVWDGKGRA